MLKPGFRKQETDVGQKYVWNTQGQLRGTKGEKSLRNLSTTFILSFLQHQLYFSSNFDFFLLTILILSVIAFICMGIIYKVLDSTPEL